MTAYVLTPRAQADLDHIWEYSSATWGADQAERYVRLLQNAVEIVAADPHKGRPCDEIRKGYRKYLVGSHILFYRRTATGVDIVRVLHTRMDFERHL